MHIRSSPVENMREKRPEIKVKSIPVTIAEGRRSRVWMSQCILKQPSYCCMDMARSLFVDKIDTMEILKHQKRISLHTIRYLSLVCKA